MCNSSRVMKTKNETMGNGFKHWLNGRNFEREKSTL